MQNDNKVNNLFRYLLLAEVLEVGVVEVHEGVIEGSDQHGTMLKQFLIQNFTCKIICALRVYHKVTDVGSVG